MTTPPDDVGNGPVIRDHRRIDPVTGQVRRGKHAASQPAGTSGAGRPPGGSEAGAYPGAGQGSETGTGTGTGAQPGHGGSGSGRHGRRSEGGEADAMGEQDGTTPEGADENEAPEAAEQTVEEEAGPAAETRKAPIAQDKGKDSGNVELALKERTADLQRLQAEYANYRKRVERDRAAVKENAVASVLTELLPVLDAIGQAREHGELSGGFKSVADSLVATVTKLGLVTYGEKGEPFDPKIHEALASLPSPDVTEETCIDILQPGYRVGDRVLRPARVAVAEPVADGGDNGNDTD